MSVPTSTSMSPFKGADNVVQFGSVAIVAVLKVSSVQAVASPSSLYGIIVT